MATIVSSDKSIDFSANADAYILPPPGFPDHIKGSSTWDANHLQQHPEEWLHFLTPEEIEDIDKAVKHFTKSKVTLEEISPESFPLTVLNLTIEKQTRELFHGIGFGLFRGLPVTKYSREDQAAIILGIGSYIGARKPQNAKGHILGHVKDLTQTSTTKYVYDVNDPTTRVYSTRKEQLYHNDSSDIVALLCLSQAQEGGSSSIVSSHRLYNMLRKQRPDIVQLMAKPWLWDRKNENGPNEPNYVDSPPFIFYENKLFTFWSASFFETVTRFPGVTIPEEQYEAMRYVQSLCEKEGFHMNLEVGDIQFVQNYQVLHARSAYVDTPEKTRHLLRLWLDAYDDHISWKTPLNTDLCKYTFNFKVKHVTPLEAE
ncbi:hypothetical protein BDB01DRAFT_715247 [Pilobolus umbonatus]|nr:hypothetical protein BDB01DRAFT_715247 [Pilobolus umbonatus]